MPRKSKIEQEATHTQPIIVSKISRTPQLLKGTKDILPAEQKYWTHINNLINKMMVDYSFERLDTPILEELALFSHSVGKQTDIVEKEMYFFTDKNGDEVALRPEFTAGIARAYIEHGMWNLVQPVKLFTTGPVFRHDKPQAGRFRQFHQFNCEILGEEKPVVDVQLILVAFNFFKQLGIQTIVHVNSIGCINCRALYRDALIEYYKSKKNLICVDCKRRQVKNVLRLLDCKEEGCLEVRKDAPQIIDYFCDECRDHFMKVLEFLDELNIPYQLDPYLVRGLDYYNRTTFELYSQDSESGTQSALAGGGRYDKLVEMLGGHPTPACGFGIGIERTILKIKELASRGVEMPVIEKKEVDIFLAQLGDQAKRKAMVLFEELLKDGFLVAENFAKDSLKAQLEQANKLGVKYTLILGQKELLDGTIIIRNMEGGEQEVIDSKKLIIHLRKKLGHDLL